MILCVCVLVIFVEFFSLELVLCVFFYDWGGFGFFFFEMIWNVFLFVFGIVNGYGIVFLKDVECESRIFYFCVFDFDIEYCIKNIEICFLLILSLYFNWNWFYFF